MSASLADIILRSPEDSFPYVQSPNVFSTFNLQNLAVNRFANFKAVELHPNLTMYLGGPDDDPEEIEAYIQKEFKGIYYRNKDGEEGYNPIADKKLVDIKLFVSHDGAYLLKQHEALEKSLRADELAIFLEIPDGDIFSGTVLLIRAGADALEYADKILQHKFVTERYELSKDQRELLLSSLSSGESFWDMVVNVAISIKNAVVEGVADLGAYIFGGISDLIANNLRIKKSVWDSSDPEYGLGKVEKAVLDFLEERNQVLAKVVQSESIIIQGVAVGLPKWVVNIFGAVSKIATGVIRALEEIKGYLEANFAFICGLWNGLIDLLSGIFALVKLLFQGISASNSLEQNSAYYQSLVIEYLDNFIQAALGIDWGEVVKTILKAQFDLFLFIYLIPGKILKSLENINYSKLAYYTGYIVFQIVEFIFPPIKLAKIGKVDDFVKVIEKAIGSTLNSFSKVGTAAKKGASQISKLFFELINEFIALLKRGTGAISKFIDDVYKAIKKWLDDLLKSKKIKVRGGTDLNKSYADNVGFKTTKVVSKGKVIGQTTDHTCVASSLRMHLDDLKIERSEDFLAGALKTDDKGARILDIPEALYNSRLDDVLTQAEKSISYSKLKTFLDDGNPAIVSVNKKGFGAHAVLVEGIEKGKVVIRDPLPINQGSKYSISVADFKRIFAKKAVIFK